MTKREKRLEKGIDSLEEQKIIHQKKKELATELGQEELVEYYRELCKSQSSLTRSLKIPY